MAENPYECLSTDEEEEEEDADNVSKHRSIQCCDQIGGKVKATVKKMIFQSKGTPSVEQSKPEIA